MQDQAAGPAFPERCRVVFAAVRGAFLPSLVRSSISLSCTAVLLRAWWSYYVPGGPTMCPPILLCAWRSYYVPGGPAACLAILCAWWSYYVSGNPTVCLVVLLHAWRSSKPRGLPSWSLVPSGGHQRQSNPHGRHAGCCAVTGMCHGW